jgi:hypothetical protein
MRWRAVSLLLLISVAAFAQEKQAPSNWITTKEGCRVWDPSPEPNETASWSGACNDGVAGGNGVLQWYENGKPSEHYEGEMLDGRYDGHGVMTWANGDHYDGGFKDGSKHGHGVYTWASGFHYEGDWPK